MSAEENAWRRLEETVFQINDLSQRFWRGDSYSLGRKGGKTKGEKTAFFVPIMFDKASRTFNWVLVAPPLLEAAASGRSDDYAREALKLVIDGLGTRVSQDGPGGEAKTPWERFKARYSYKPSLNKHIDLIRNNVNANAVPSARAKELSADGNVENVWTAIVMLYAHYSHPKDQNLEGIFFRILEEVGHSCPADLKDAVFGLNNGEELDLRAWKTARKTSSTIENSPKHDGVETIKNKDRDGRYYSKSRVEEAEIVRKVLLDPLVMDFSFGEKVSFKEGTKSHPFQLLAPIYDVWNGREGWGGLKAVLLIFLKPSSSTKAAESVIGNPEWESHYDRMRNRCSALANEITQAAIRRALARPIEPPYDLVRHFLRILVDVQDWEEAVVYYEGTTNYLFKRLTYEWREEGKQEKYKGVREPWKEYEIYKNGEDYEYKFPELPDDKTATRQDDVTRRLTGPDAQSSGLVDTGEFYMWWTAKDEEGWQDLWSKAVLPGLSDDERAVVSGTSIRFKFPKACRIPPKNNKAAREFLVESYRRQQLELMRGLIPKVRARRAALRNTVSAIMGRNMSHNIGSHVLARYAAEIGKTATKETATEPGEATPKSGGEKIDPAADFLSYLQRRMDFLAEVGTSDKAFWTQPLLLGTQLDRLNLKHERERLRDEFTPLLTYITGKDDLPADVKFDEFPPLTLFSCPGGEVGVHALYVILENVIRNSTRHNPQYRGEVQIKVCTESQTEYPGLIKLRITDTGSKIKKGKNLPQDINNIITGEHILDEDGGPNPQYWGIREMQICAQYLRQLQLSDLEDVPYAEQDMTAKAPLITAAEGKPGDCLSYVIYLREAKPLAKIEIGDETKLGDMKDGVAQVTLSRALLAPEEASRPEDALREERDVLRQIRNYIFVAYDGVDASYRPNDLGKWAERHAGDLPLRRLTHIPPITEKNPKLLLESLYEALAKQIQKAQDRDGAEDNTIPLAEPAGLVLAREAKLKTTVCRFAAANDTKPLTVKSAPNEGDGRERLKSLLKKASDRRLDACIWLDHPAKEEVRYYSFQVRACNSISVEPIFSHSPAAEAICALNPGEGWELIAAAMPRIVVLDERVQAAAGNEVRGTLKVIDCWEGMHIAVPTTEQVKMDGPTFDGCRAYLKSLQKTANYVILHLTVLEKLNDERRRKDANETHLKTIEALICDTKAESATIMTVTGRGVSTFARSGRDLALAKRVRYLPVSALLEYLARRPSKLGLMRVLWSASSPRRESGAESNPDISRP